jgi:hypothetical protein
MILPGILATLDKVMLDKSYGYQRIQASFLMAIAQMAISSILTIAFVQPYRYRLKVVIRVNFICFDFNK